MTGNNAAWLSALVFSLAHAAPAQTPSPLPSVKLDFGSLTGPLDNVDVIDPVVTYGGELTVQAGELRGDLLHQQYQAMNHVRVHDIDTTLLATALQFNGKTNIGAAQQAQLTQRPYLIHAPLITVTPDTITATNGSLTTAPPGTRPDLEARVGDLTLYPAQKRGIMHQASLYFLHTRIVTVRRITFKTGGASQSSRNQAILPAVGVSSRYGPYLVYNGALSHPTTINYRLLLPSRQPPQARLSAQQPLIVLRTPAPPKPAPPDKHDYLGALRLFATAPKPPLPEDDPLLFRSFLPEPDPIRPLAGPPSAGLYLNETVATHEEASGRRLTNLYVSRLPDVGLSGTLPLSPVPADPTPGDPDARRRFLRRVVVVADAGVDYGYFEEQPYHLHATRQRDSLGLSLHPLLIAPNTLFLPRLEYTTNFYSGQRSPVRSYRYFQASAEVAHYFSPYRAISVQYLQADTSGDSPFNFDVLDTSQELKVRLQFGNRRLAVAGQVRFDLTQGGIYDYKLAVAPGLNGVTPVVSYNFRNRSVGLGAEIPGLSF